MIDREWLRRLPKAELHCHLDGSVRPETLLELATAYGVPLPARDGPGIRAAVRAPRGSSLEAYLSCFTVTLSVLQTAAALERVAYEVAEDAAGDGAWYLELRFAPLLNTGGGLTTEAVVAAVARGLRRAEAAHGIVCRIIVCALRQLDADTSLDTARLAVALRGEGVVGFDLAGPEAGHPAATHAASFLYAREHDLSCTCHAGEADDARSVRQAIHRCGAHRVGHATRMIEDAALTGYAADHRITVEACLTSNLQTGAAPSYAAHPLRAFLERGVPVALCTDNRLVSDTTLVDEYAHAVQSQGLSVDQVTAVARAGFAAAFLPWAERRTLLRRFDAAVTTGPGATAPP